MCVGISINGTAKLDKKFRDILEFNQNENIGFIVNASKMNHCLSEQRSFYLV